MPSLRRTELLAMLFVPLATLVVADEASGSGLRPFEYYRAILDRKPFGELAPPPAPAGPVNVADSQEAIEEKRKEDALAKQIDMVAVNRTPRGKIAVGFIDKNAKPPRNYYLNVGDMSGGFKVLAADFDEEIATIEKDGVSIVLKLGKGVIPKEELQGDASGPAAGPVVAPISGGQAAQAIQAGSANMPAGQGTSFGRSSFPGIRRGGSAFRPPLPSAAEGASGASGGYRGAVRIRKAQEMREKAEREREEQRKINEEVERRTEAATEAAAKLEREANLKLIKSGQDPVSEIELTPEEDAELVNAGVLDAPAPPPQAQ